MIFPKFYSFFYDWLKKIKNHQELDVDDVNLVGSRLSGKSLNLEFFFILACNLFDKYKKAIKVDIFAFRYEAQDKAELFSDFLRALDFVIRIYPQIKYSVKVNHIYFPATKSSIRIFGITTKNMKRIKKTGLSHSSAEYIFKFFEERAEFGGADIQDVNEAVRGVGKYKMTTFSASNPRTLSNEYIAWCNTNMRFSEGVLREKFYQISKREIMLDENIKARTLFVYNNWRVIKDKLTLEQISNIKRSYQISYQRGLWADIGFPSSEALTVYGAFLHRIEPPVYEWHDRVGGGGDIGQGSSKGSGITSFVFGAVNKYKCVDIYDEFTHDNKHQELPSDILFQRIIDFYIKNWMIYQTKSGQKLTTVCYVRVDFSDKTFIDGLNKYAYKNGVAHWLIFTKCSKLAINDRVVDEKYLMSKGHLRIDQLKCKNLLGELATVEWSDRITIRPQRHGADHGINAMEYFLEPEMMSNLLISPIDLPDYRKDYIRRVVN